MASANGSGRLTPRQLAIEEKKKQKQAERLARKQQRDADSKKPQKIRLDA